MAINVNALIALADKKTNDELAEYGVSLPEGVAAALKEELEKEQKMAASSAAREIISLLKKTDSLIEQGVKGIRKARAEISTIKQGIAEVQKAKEYGMETNNWLPLAVVTGTLSAREASVLVDVSLTQVPKGWVSKQERLSLKRSGN